MARVLERGLEEWALRALCEEWPLGAGCRGGGRGAPSEAGGRARSLSASGLDTRGRGGGPVCGPRAGCGEAPWGGGQCRERPQPCPCPHPALRLREQRLHPQGPWGRDPWPAPAWGLAMPSSSGWQPCRAGEKRPPGSSRQCWSHCSAGGFGEGPGRSQDPGGLREARAQTWGPPKDSEGLAVGKKPAAQLSLPLLLPTKPPP